MSASQDDSHQPRDNAETPDRANDNKAASFAAAHGGLPQGQAVGPYRVRSLLGSGAFGVVYLAKDTRTDQNVALKLPRLEVLMDPEKRRRFEIEASIGAGLNHPGIVAVLESGSAGSLPYIATAWCDGSDLGRWLDDCEKGHQPLPTWRQAAELIADIAEAVQYAHEKGVAHRDLKPANVLLEFKKTESGNGLNEDGLSQFQAKVSDFGLAKLSEAAVTDTRSSLLVGTPVYMAPERIAGQTTVDEKSLSNQGAILADVYSLGAMLLELLTGKPPLSGANYLELVGQAVRLSDASPSKHPDGIPQGLPNGLPKIISACLRSRPSFRYQSAADLASDLRRSLNGEPVQGKPVKLRTSFRYWIANRDWAAIAGWFAIGSQVLFTVWMMLSDLFKVRFNLLTSEQYIEMLPELIWIAATTSLTTVVIGVISIFGVRWASWVGAALAAFNLWPALVALFYKPTFFSQIYENSEPYFTFKIHLVISLVFICQLVLYLFAIAAPYAQLKR